MEVDQTMKERVSAMYGMTPDEMDHTFQVTKMMLSSTDKKTVLIENIMKHYGITKEAVMVSMSCGAMF